MVYSLVSPQIYKRVWYLIKVSKTVDDISYFVFHDRKVVCFATNVFPDTMPDAVFRLQADGTLCSQSVSQSVPPCPPCLPAYNLTYEEGTYEEDIIMESVAGIGSGSCFILWI